MKCPRFTTPTAAAVLFALTTAAACTSVDYLKQEPPAESIPYGKVVYVDDGTCPAGQVKQVTGGSQTQNIRRQVRCVKRPQ